MNSRERVQTALAFEEPDRPPVFATFVPEIEEHIRTKLGIHDSDLGAALGNDMIKSCVGLEQSFYGQPEPEYQDAWGITWRYVRNRFGVFTEIVDHPLSGDKSKLDTYQIPDPKAPEQYHDFLHKKEQYGRDQWLIGSSQISIFEAAWYLRGLDQFLVDMLVEPDFATALLDKVMRFPLEAARQYIRLDADMVWFGDDVSTQSGMMISLDLWRQFLKSRYAALFSACREVCPNITIAYHSCGNCWDILDDLVEIGLNVLNPLQPLAIDPLSVKKRYGKRLALFGGLCVQQDLPYASPEYVETAVQRLKKELGQGGGYLLAPAHHIQADTPWENIQAFYRAALD